MARGAPVVFRGFSGGLNTQAAPYELGPSETPDCMNVRGSLRGSVRKRNGFVDLSDGTNFASQPRKLAIYRAGATTKVVALGTSLQVLEPGGAPGAVTAATTTAPWRWAWASAMQQDGQGPLFLMSDVEQRYYDGATFGTWTATSGAVPVGRVMCAHMNRIYIGDISSLPDKRCYVAWSEIGEPRSWPVAQINGFDPFQGDRITALCSLGSYLLVFKRDGIWRVYDNDTGANVKIASQSGTVFRDSVVATDRGCVFLDPDRGVMVTDGQGQPKVLSDKVLPDLRGLPLDEESAANVAAAYWEGSYWLSVPDGAGNPSVLFELDLESGAWWRHDCAAYDLQVAPFGQSVDPLLVRDALIGAPSAMTLQALGTTLSGDAYRVVQLMRPNAWQDQLRGQDPAPVRFRWRSPPTVLDGNPSMRKRLRELRFDALGSSQVFLMRDFPTVAQELGALADAGGAESGQWGYERGGATWGQTRTGVWGGSSTIVQSQFLSLGLAREVQVELRGTSTSDFQLHSYVLYVGPRARKD